MTISRSILLILPTRPKNSAPLSTIKSFSSPQCFKDTFSGSITQDMITSAKLPRLIAILQALIATVILGSTLVLVKLALNDLGPLTITAVRYSLAFLVLLPFLLARGGLGHYPAWLWKRFILLGLSFYVIGNGALYVGLQFIPATTGSLLLSFVPLIVMLSGVFLLHEIPTRRQWVGLAFVLSGSALFFSADIKPGEPLGIAIVAVGLLGNATFSILGRDVQRRRSTSTLTLTAIPLAVGSIILLPLALLIEGVPQAPLSIWALVFLLAALNTAGVYALMNHALKVLAAFELAIIVNFTPFLTALWSWLLLSEKLHWFQVNGILVVILGALLVERSQPVSTG
jgi:drug/metabolite transporter (DMT)-like permease